MKILYALIVMSLTGGLLTLIVYLIKNILISVFGPHCIKGLYILLLCIFVLPVSLSMEIKTENNKYETNVVQKYFAVEAQHTEYGNTTKSLKAENKDILEKTAFVFILSVAFFIVAWKLIKYFMLNKNLKKESEYIFSKNKLGVYISSKVSSPILMGVFNHKLFLPDVEMTKDDIDNILSHELTHLKNNDVVIKWILMFVSAVHWFNPAIHLLKKEIYRYSEICCDLDTIKYFDEEKENSYLKTILDMMDNSMVKIELSSSFSVCKKQILERFKFIKNFKRKSMVISALSFILVFGIIISGLTLSGILNNKNLNNTFLHINLSVDKNIKNSIDSQPPVHKVEKRFEEIREQQPSAIDDAEGKALNNAFVTDEKADENDEENKEPEKSNPSQLYNRIKSNENAEGEYYPMENVELGSMASVDSIISILEESGITESKETITDLTSNYLSGTLSYMEMLENDEQNIKCDSNGNITVMFDTSDVVYFDIEFYENDSDVPLAGYGVLSRKGAAYTFCGFDADKSYNVTIKGATRDAMKVEGEYIIY